MAIENRCREIVCVQDGKSGEGGGESESDIERKSEGKWYQEKSRGNLF